MFVCRRTEKKGLNKIFKYVYIPTHSANVLSCIISARLADAVNSDSSCSVTALTLFVDRHTSWKSPMFPHLRYILVSALQVPLLPGGLVLHNGSKISSIASIASIARSQENVLNGTDVMWKNRAEEGNGTNPLICLVSSWSIAQTNATQ